MENLIKIENGTSLLDSNVSNQIAEFERQMKAIKEQEEALKEAIKAEMEAKGILKIEDEINGMTISYVASTTRENFDKNKFQDDFPDLYDEYVKIIPVKSSIRIKLN
jgi:regulator of replication initiation timing